jgi:hypothetical protein
MMFDYEVSDANGTRYPEITLQGYIVLSELRYETTLRQITSQAHTSLANVYVYFDSKYQIVFEVYEP